MKAYIDSHCHLDFTVFSSDLSDVIADAHRAGITAMIIPSVSASNWHKVYQLTQQFKGLYAAFGLHPMFLEQHEYTHIVSLDHFLKTHDAIAIGECGLDYFLPALDQEKQLQLFIEHLKLADKYSLPLIIHARKSIDIILKYLRQYPNSYGVIHSFSGSEQQAYQCIAQGFLLGFGGPITYTRAKKLRHLVTTLPLESLLLETDAPDQPASAHHGQRSEPRMVVEIATTFAQLRECSIEKIANTTTLNAKKLFGL